MEGSVDIHEKLRKGFESKKWFFFFWNFIYSIMILLNHSTRAKGFKRDTEEIRRMLKFYKKQRKEFSSEGSAKKLEETC